MNPISNNFISFVLLFLMGFVSINNAEEKKSNEIKVKEFLIAGPLAVKPPAIIEIDSESINLKDMLEYKYAEIKEWWPENGDKFYWDNNAALEWQNFEAAGKDGILLEANGKKYSLYYIATYIQTKSYFNGSLKVNSHHLFEAFADGIKIYSKTKSDSEKPKLEEFVTGDLSLPPGKHLIILKTFYDKNNSLPWAIKVKLEYNQEFNRELISTTINPEKRMTLRHLLDAPELKGISLSYNGKYAAINYRQIKDGGNGYVSWIDIINTESNKVVFPKRIGENLSRLKWVPGSSKFTYVNSEDKKSTIHLVDLKSGESSILIENLDNFSDYQWAPDASFLIYAMTEKAKEEKEGLRKLQGMPDRLPGFRDKDELYVLNIKSGTNRQLTKSSRSSGLLDIDQESKKILFMQSEPDFKNRPYSKSFVYQLDLNTMQLDSIWSGYWFRSASYSPDGSKLLVNGAPEIFNGIGNTLPEKIIPGGSETETYIFDLKSGNIDPITKNFNPSVLTSYWHKNNIFVTVTEKSKKQLYTYDLNSKTFTRLKIGIDAIDKISYANNAELAAYYGSSATQPHAAYFINLKNQKITLLANPAKDYFQHTKLSSVKRWTFKNKENVEIEGRVYYPPHFDADKKYPCIVYYYGGVSPVERDFGGRYPKNFYSAHDYIVYVLQPSGSVGFGQEFAAKHVNDWGKIVADEIIEGVGQFLEAHPFVDKNRVGCIGASYGGFMTMLLVTRTDMFAAAVSHAGISDITSYWGEGFWGYWYNSISAANSFPWNRRDIYVDQSPLFAADQIKTPLLLTHGDSDTNVPPGESRQLYTALKLLGNEVELIEVAGQDHWILEYNKRKKWTNTIVAWFDKWLKDDDSWWKALYSD